MSKQPKSSSEAAGSPLQEFAELARKLVSVPKEELDEKQAEYESGAAERRKERRKPEQT